MVLSDRTKVKVMNEPRSISKGMIASDRNERPLSRTANRTPPSGKKGFTLVELMVVLLVISILAAISVVGATSMRVQANENLAKNSLKQVSSSAESYHTAQGTYPTDLATLGNTYLGSGLASGEKAGYNFELKSGNSGETYSCTAVPKSKNYTGVKSYCIDGRNLINVYENSSNLKGDGEACPSGGTPLGS